MKSIKQIQEEIIAEFDFLGNDLESKIFYIMELGQKMPTIDKKFKIDQNLVKGCQSKVWIFAQLEENNLILHADSNTELTKGLIGLLVRVFSGQPLDEILQAELFFLEKIGMGKVIGSQRSNGLAAMIKQIKIYALAFKAKQNAH